MHRILHRTASVIGRDSRLVKGLRIAYESFEGWAAHGRGVSFRINGLEFRRHPHCRDRFPVNLVYEPKVAAFLESRVKPGHVCLDVGANVGYYVLQLAHWTGPLGHVVAFEPNPGPRGVLENLINLNGIDSLVSVVPAAVGAVTGRQLLYIPPYGTRGLDGLSRLDSPAKELGPRTSAVCVRVTTLDDYCENFDIIPDWILIDVEGFEFAALCGARKLIARRRLALGLVVEMHPDLWPSSLCPSLVLKHLRLRPIPLTGQMDPLAERGVVCLEPN
jgi:FkbM family methyltransferase